jgi:dTDP-4-dehydrorhamnose 3,5-epimerase
MDIKERKLKGVFEIQLSPRFDARGFFVRTFDNNIFDDAGLGINWVQENHSRSMNQGIIRGLHLQLPPFAETKLVRCSKGTILDVFVDLRANSETFAHWDSVVLSEENFKMVLVPKGFAHGFCTLTDQCDVLYKVDNYYKPDAEVGILWNDESLKISWPVLNPIISNKDSKNISLELFINQYLNINT